MEVIGGNHLLVVWRDASLNMKTRILFASEFSLLYSVIRAEKKPILMDPEAYRRNSLQFW